MNAAPRKSLLRKRASRLAASQALYARSLTQQKPAVAAMVAQISQSWADSREFDAPDLPYETQPEQALLSTILTSAMAHEAQIEATIEGVILPHWKKSRMSLPLLSTLRAAAAEYLAFPAKPRAVLIEEYTEIASQLVSDEEVAYAHKAFNLLLDALAHAPDIAT
jgi:transcription termination factor NusB